MERVKNSAEPLRVLYLVDSLRVGGKERQTVQFVTGLAARAEAQVALVWLDRDDFFGPALRASAVQCLSVPRRCRWDLSVLVRLRKFCREFRPQIVHTTCWMTSFYGWPLARLTGAKWVNGSIRNAFPAGGARWHAEKLLLRMADAVIANSAAGLASRGFTPSVQQRRYVVWNGFDRARLVQLDDSPAVELRRTAAGRPIVGMVAQFKDDKDYATFCEAARRIPRTLFVAVGDGKNFELHCRQHGLPGGPVLFMGRQSNVEALVRAFDVGVLATFVEGFSNAVLEYMALGKPVVATDGGGTAEVVVDGVTGWLTPPRDAEALAQRIQSLLDDPSKAQAMGERGRERVEREFSIEVLVGKTLRIYTDLLTGNSVAQ